MRGTLPETGARGAEPRCLTVKMSTPLPPSCFTAADTPTRYRLEANARQELRQGSYRPRHGFHLRRYRQEGRRLTSLRDAPVDRGVDPAQPRRHLPLHRRRGGEHEPGPRAPPLRYQLPATTPSAGQDLGADMAVCGCPNSAGSGGARGDRAVGLSGAGSDGLAEAARHSRGAKVKAEPQGHTQTGRQFDRRPMRGSVVADVSSKPEISHSAIAKLDRVLVNCTG